MNDLATSIINSLDGKGDKAIYPYLPYILQDLWGLGSSAENIIKVIRENKIINEFSGLNILDLGCGKGAVSIRLAKEFKSPVHGLDGFSEFIEEAKQKSVEYNVQELCTFEADDIREFVKTSRSYNVVILAAIGDVLGNVTETLLKLSNCLVPGGYAIIEDGIIPDESSFKSDPYITKTDYFNQVEKSSFKIIEIRWDEVVNTDRQEVEMFNLLKARALELIEKYPDKKEVFEHYINSQDSETEILQNDVKTFLILLKKI